RIEVFHSSLQEFQPVHKFDAIISNPPYFVDSLLSPDDKRTTARHTATLSFEELVEGVMRLLATEGTFSLILPPAECDRFLSSARGRLFVTRRCEVWSTPTSGVKRIMTELKATPPEEIPPTEKIIIEEHGVMGYGEKYKALTKDFYLKF
ncbi:MAG: methyltransferase, partial [Alistipes sp.]|nr:methyltransferase [Alistipes sp.]